MWSPCVSGAAYTFAVDWDSDGAFTETYDDVTEDVLDRGIEISYGRDQFRQLAPPMVGNQSFSLCNVSRLYSPENTGSPLFGEVEPARETSSEVVFGSTTYPLFRGRIDDFEIHVDRGDRSVDFTMLDGLAVLAGVKLSTEVLTMQRTGAIIDHILDQVGWTAGRDIDLGATHVPWWWAEGTDAFDAVKDLVLSEGPPAIAYVAPDGTFVFRDRHHRLLREASTTPQARFSAPRVDCAAPVVTGFSFAEPFSYHHGWSDIINSVDFSVDERTPDAGYSVVWSTDTPITIANGETITIDVEATDPFTDAQNLTLNDVIWNSSLVALSATFDRRSGQSMKVNLTASGGTAVVTYMQVRARAVPVGRTIKVSQMDTESIDMYGERSYTGDVPWAGVHDAYAITSLILGYYARRRPTVQLRLCSEDQAHLSQILTRTISDRITIQHDELGLDGDFLVEQVSHTITRINQDAQGPVHSVVLGCERALVDTGGVNVFTFDKTGAGFDQGVFGEQGIDDPTQIFIFDHATQGQFDLGRFAT